MGLCHHYLLVLSQSMSGNVVTSGHLMTEGTLDSIELNDHKTRSSANEFSLGRKEVETGTVFACMLELS